MTTKKILKNQAKKIILTKPKKIVALFAIVLLSIGSTVLNSNSFIVFTLPLTSIFFASIYSSIVWMFMSPTKSEEIELIEDLNASSSWTDNSKYIVRIIHDRARISSLFFILFCQLLYINNVIEMAVLHPVQLVLGAIASGFIYFIAFLIYDDGNSHRISLSSATKDLLMGITPPEIDKGPTLKDKLNFKEKARLKKLAEENKERNAIKSAIETTRDSLPVEYRSALSSMLTLVDKKDTNLSQLAIQTNAILPTIDEAIIVYNNAKKLQDSDSIIRAEAVLTKLINKLDSKNQYVTKDKLQKDLEVLERYADTL